MIYNLFSRIFARKADREFLESLVSKDITDIIGGVCEDSDTAESLKENARDIVSDKDKLSEAESDFERLFIIPLNDKFIPPYIGYYLGNTSKTSGGSNADIDVKGGDVTRAEKLEIMFKSLNFTPKDESWVTSKRADHIAYILGFMAALISFEEKHPAEQVKERPPLSEIVSEEFYFFNEFIGNWINLFAEEVIQRGGSPFYVQAAMLMKSFIRCEQRDFNSLPIHSLGNKRCTVNL